MTSTRYRFQTEVRTDLSLHSLPDTLIISCDPEVTLTQIDETTTLSDIAFYVRSYLVRILQALRPNTFRIYCGFTLRRVSSNFLMLVQGNRLAGVIKIEEPPRHTKYESPNVLNNPAVLQTLLDELLLLHGFYAPSPVFGIVTTLQEWRFCWLPEDHEIFNSRSDSISYESFKFPYTPSFLSPIMERLPRVCTHGIIEAKAASSGDAILALRDLRLYTSPVLQFSTEYTTILQYMYTFLVQMAHTQQVNAPTSPRLLFQLHRDEGSTALTWYSLEDCPEGYLQQVGESDKCPGKEVSALLVVEDLGRGASGKGLLTGSMPVAGDTPSVCVLKFSNDDCTYRLEWERDWWNLLYPEFSDFVFVEIWSGCPALRLPHFSPLPVERREDLRSAIHTLLTHRFGTQYVHQDVAWRNIGAYKQGDQEVPVLFDLDNIVVYREEQHAGWIEKAMSKLYPLV